MNNGYVILNDGDTFTDVDGCEIMLTGDNIDDHDISNEMSDFVQVTKQPYAIVFCTELVNKIRTDKDFYEQLRAAGIIEEFHPDS